MATSTSRKRGVAAVNDEDQSVPSPRSTKRLRNLRLHEEPLEGGECGTASQPTGGGRRVTRSTRSKGAREEVKDACSGVSDITDENRAPVHEQDTQEDVTSDCEGRPAGITNPRNAFTTPHKQRFRDALASPRSAKAPTTPRHRVVVGARPLTPRTPRTPRAMALAGLRPTYTVYTSAKRLFARNASPGQLVGRETERDELQSVIASAVKSCKGSCVYISGPPGTGKSAVVGGLLGEFDIADYLKAQQGVKELRQIRTASVNCASMNNARDIFGRLLEELAPGTAQQQLFKKSASDALQDMFLAPIDQKAPTPFYIVTLDEVEHLLSTPITAHGMHSDDSSVLSTLFEWSLSARSRLLLIGVANALDLTDQFLPRLKSKNLKPILLPFMPYTPSQISKIITSKLQSLMSPEANGASSDSPPTEQPPPGFVPFMHPAAIQLCARKVASTTGDLRKAFELVRRAIDLVEKETMQARKAAADAAGLHTSDHREFPNLDPQSPTRPAQRAAVKQPLQENANLATRVTPPDTPGKPQRNSTPGTMPTLPTLTPANAPRATVAHVARVTSTVSGNGISDRLALLTLQQKAALCALIASNHSSASSSSQSSEDPGAASRVSTPRKSRSSQPASGSTDQTTVKRVFSTYVTMCRKEKLLVPLSSSEFSDILSSLESSGLIELANARSGPSTPSRTPRRRGLGDAGETIVQCFVSEQEVLSSLQGAGEGVLKTLIAN